MSNVPGTAVSGRDRILAAARRHEESKSIPARTAPLEKDFTDAEYLALVPTGALPQVVYDPRCRVPRKSRQLTLNKLIAGHLRAEGSARNRAERLRHLQKPETWRACLQRASAQEAALLSRAPTRAAQAPVPARLRDMQVYVNAAARIRAADWQTSAGGLAAGAPPPGPAGSSPGAAGGATVERATEAVPETPPANKCSGTSQSDRPGVPPAADELAAPSVAAPGSSGAAPGSSAAEPVPGAISATLKTCQENTSVTAAPPQSAATDGAADTSAAKPRPVGQSPAMKSPPAAVKGTTASSAGETSAATTDPQETAVADRAPQQPAALPNSQPGPLVRNAERPTGPAHRDSAVPSGHAVESSASGAPEALSTIDSGNCGGTSSPVAASPARAAAAAAADDTGRGCANGQAANARFVQPTFEQLQGILLSAAAASGAGAKRRIPDGHQSEPDLQHTKMRRAGPAYPN